MPHGGYHGNVVIGGNVVQSGYQKPDGSYGISGGIDDESRLDLNPPSGGSGSGDAQTAAEATAAAEAKKKEILENFPITLTDPDQSKGSFRKGLNLSDVTTTQTVPPSMGFTQTVNPFGADDVRALAMDFDRENQILNNLLIAQQQAANREGIIRAAQQGVLNASDLTGYDDDGLFGTTIGATPSTGISGIRTVFNPFTGEPLGGTTGVVGENLATQIKAREGLTTPQYNQFIADLYDANPELYQETFPFASGQIAKPILARIGEGIMRLPGASQIGQLASSVISPLSGLFTGKTAATGFVNPKASTDGGGIPQAVPEGMDMSIYGSFIGKPGPFTADFVDQDGDGVDDRFQSGPGEAKAPPYSPPKQPANIFPSIGLPAIANYASMAPQFRGSQYTNQGVSPAFLENLRRFYG